MEPRHPNAPASASSVARPSRAAPGVRSRNGAQTACASTGARRSWRSTSRSFSFATVRNVVSDTERRGATPSRSAVRRVESVYWPSKRRPGSEPIQGVLRGASLGGPGGPPLRRVRPGRSRRRASLACRALRSAIAWSVGSHPRPESGGHEPPDGVAVAASASGIAMTATSPSGSRAQNAVSPSLSSSRWETDHGADRMLATARHVRHAAV